MSSVEHLKAKTPLMNYNDSFMFSHGYILERLQKMRTLLMVNMFFFSCFTLNIPEVEYKDGWMNG